MHETAMNVNMHATHTRPHDASLPHVCRSYELYSLTKLIHQFFGLLLFLFARTAQASRAGLPHPTTRPNLSVSCVGPSPGVFVGRSVNVGNVGVASSYQYTNATLARVRPSSAQGNPRGMV